MSDIESDEIEMASMLKEIFKKFMAHRFPEDKEGTSYYTEWEKRFEQGEEWQKSDFHTRRVLMQIAPNIYPKDQTAYFIRE